MIKVVVIDDHAVVRMGLKYVLGVRKNEFAFVGEWPGGDGACELYEDDGISLGYRGGKFSTTALSVEEKGGAVVFKVSPRKGSFSGMPASRRFSTASTACRAVWRRPMALRIGSSNDCTPMLTRFTPNASRAAHHARVTSSGFASMVNSSRPDKSNAPRKPRTSRSSNGMGNCDGVPPPR